MGQMTAEQLAQFNGINNAIPLPQNGAPMDTPMVAADEIPMEAQPMQMAQAQSPLNMDFSQAPATRKEFDALPGWKRKVFEAAWGGAQFDQSSLQQFILGEMSKENDELRKMADPKYKAETEAAQTSVIKAKAEMLNAEKERANSQMASKTALESINKYRGYMDDGLVGPWQDIAQKSDEAGIGDGSQERYAKRKELMVSAQESVLKNLQNFKGAISNAEREFLQKMFPNINEPPKVWKNYFDKAEEVFKRDVPSAGPKKLDQATALQFLKQAGGDKMKARELAKQSGY